MYLNKNYISGFMLTKGMLLTGMCVGLLSSFASCSKHMIAHDGTTQYTIVQSDKATVSEKYAAQELTNFLSRVTGASFPVVAESALSGKTRGIYVGWTKYAAKNGIKASKLGEEEWIIRSVGKNLVLIGGRPRGTLYAVYEFLERQVGCHWLDWHTEVVPSKPTLKLGEINVRGKPWFWLRKLYAGPNRLVPPSGREKLTIYKIRNKNYRARITATGLQDRDFTRHGFPVALKDAFYQVYGGPKETHNYHCYLNADDWFETHPHCFALNDRGERVPCKHAYGPGQLCLTHPDTRRLVAKSLRSFIARDRAKCPTNPPRIYMINQADASAVWCQCTNCQKLVAREGGRSGLVIDFANAVAEEIEKEYPDIFVAVAAYSDTRTPPRTLKARRNVLVDLCPLTSIHHPQTHPNNATDFEMFLAWRKIAPNLSINLDWLLFGEYIHFPVPYSIIHAIVSDLSLYADSGVKIFTAETHDFIEAGQHFVPLKFWLAYQLLVNPYQPAEPLIETFMDGYYGAAAPKMEAYLHYLTERIEKEVTVRGAVYKPYNLLPYLDLDFFKTAEKMFDEAEALVRPESPELKHVQKERLIVDGALLFLWPWLDRTLASNETMPFDHETVIRSYENCWRTSIEYYFNYNYTPNVNSFGGRFPKNGAKPWEKMTALFRNPNLPEQFQNLPPRDVCDFNWLTFPVRRNVIVADKEAVGKRAFTFRKPSAKQAEMLIAAGHISKEKTGAKPITLSSSGGVPITLKPDEIPQDEKYHLYTIGRINVKRKALTVWAALGDKKLGVDVGRVFVPDAEDSRINDWNVYVSLKITGPDYVKGSKVKNTIYMDRILLVKPQPDEKPNASELKRRAELAERNARRPRVKVPCLSASGGDLLKVDWNKSAGSGKWSTLKGAPTARKVNARFAHDAKNLYIRLTDEVDTRPLVSGSEIYDGDDWELLFAGQRGEPYRQFIVNPKGATRELAYGESSWKSGANVISEVSPKKWTVFMGFPLDRLLPGGGKPGQCVYANIMRGGGGRIDSLAWSPTYEGNFNMIVEYLGEMVLE